MDLARVLEEKQDAIVRKWYDRIIGSYPHAASKFLANHQDQFSNPVGHAIREGIGPIFSQVVSSMDTGELQAALDQIIRIRSVQDFTASEAVAFVFELKPAIRAALNGDLPEAERPAGLMEIDSRIDRVALIAFDKYTECREQLHAVRIKEMRGPAVIYPARAERKRAASHEEGELSHEGD